MVELNERTAVLLDQHPLFLEALEHVLGHIGVRTVGKTGSPESAVGLVEEHRPDLFVTSIELPEGGMDGIACLREASTRSPGTKIVVLSMYDDRQSINAALSAGALAYVVKTAHPDDLRSAIRQAFDHSIYLAGSPPAAEQSRNGNGSEAAREALTLTRRELEILQLVSEGHSNAQLARMLWVTEQTVKFHLSNIYRKLDVANRTEASRWAQVHGLLDGSERVSSETPPLVARPVLAAAGGAARAG